ncbi:fimbria/pilus periplasmic chaperone [Rheinheimera texasensis]|uniref:fimbrial biogenesis chaperone n=1 Tax=Rheinheimera texasensis TaxID=306205 RepID=UPI0032B0FFAF
MTSRYWGCCAVIVLSWQAQAQGLTIWPLIAELPAGQKAVAIYLDNQSDAEQQLQIRVKAWQLQHNKEQLTDQSALLVSPPFVTIAPHQRQLVRLVYLAADKAPPQPQEQSLRVLIDDVTAVDNKTGSQVHIRMRYSLPLFVSRPAQVPVPADTQAYQQYWRDKVELSLQQAPDGTLRLRLQNRAPVHLRLSQVQLRSGDTLLWSAGSGLFSYVLAGTDFSWTITPAQPLRPPLQLQFDSYRVPLQFPVAF